MTDKTLFGAIFQFLLSYGGDCITSQRSALHVDVYAYTIIVPPEVIKEVE